MNTASSPSDPVLEREKWESERAFRERELSLAEQQFQLSQSEFALKQVEQASGRWRSPLVVAILAAAVAGIGNAVVSYITADAQTKLEAQKAEQARILEVIKTGNADTAAANLSFLLDAGLIRDSALRADLQGFLKQRHPGRGPALPAPPFVARDAQELASKFEGTQLKPYKDPTGALYIGSNHHISDAEIKKGTILIGNDEVPFANGISEQQSQKLLAQDLESLRSKVKGLVTVPLTQGQEDALVDLVFNIGLRPFENSHLLSELNQGKYEEVPKEMERWQVAGGVSLPGLVARRSAEATLWRKPEN